MSFTVPEAVVRLLTADVAVEIARTFGDQPVYPQRIIVDHPDGASGAPRGSARRFPGWPGPVLVLSDENQGVCSWGVPAGESGEVVVGGDLLDAGCATVAYAASVADFIAARRWDHRCLNTGPVLQAQAAELDLASLGYLQARLAPEVATAGWPGPRQYRFEDRDVRVLLWSQAGQCDWWVSAASPASLRHFAAGLPDLPGLGQGLWSSDQDGERGYAAELRGDGMRRLAWQASEWPGDLLDDADADPATGAGSRIAGLRFRDVGLACAEACAALAACLD